MTLNELCIRVLSLRVLLLGSHYIKWTASSLGNTHIIWTFSSKGNIIYNGQPLPWETHTLDGHSPLRVTQKLDGQPPPWVKHTLYGYSPLMITHMLDGHPPPWVT